MNELKVVREVGGDVVEVFWESISEGIIERWREKEIRRMWMGDGGFKMGERMFEIGK